MGAVGMRGKLSCRAVHAGQDKTNAMPDGNNLTIMSFFFSFSVVDLRKLEKLEHIEGSGRKPGNIEPYIVATQQSSYVNAVGDGGG
jgi:hypothetical protein